jgi:Protein of unknown function (DUF2946)
MIARRHRSQMRAPRGAWLAFLAMALQVLVPFFLMAEIARAEPGGAAVICSAIGHQTPPGGNNAGDHGLADHCSICTTLAAAQGFAPAGAPPLPLPATIGRSTVTVADLSAPALLVNSAYQSRGPPSIA